MRVALVSVLLFAVSGCTAVVLIEDSARVCANGVDDDGNGLTDCADPSCDGSGVCEATADACGNDVDDDGDGLTDCAEADCQVGGFCDSFASPCSVVPQTGCPTGMACYRAAAGTTETETRCRSAGLGRAAAACSGPAIDALGPSSPHPCASGFGCVFAVADGTCGAYCASDADCPTGGVCAPPPAVSGRPGLCTTPCNPQISGSCPASLACVSFHERGATYDEGGARWACFDASLMVGTADVGSPCTDGAAPGTPRERICRSSAACVPDLGGATATCRALCDVLDPACPSSGRCERLYPTGAPSAVGMTVFGVCY